MAAWVARVVRPWRRREPAHAQLMEEIGVYRAELRTDLKDAALGRAAKASRNPFMVALVRAEEKRRDV